MRILLHKILRKNKFIPGKIRRKISEITFNRIERSIRGKSIDKDLGRINYIIEPNRKLNESNVIFASSDFKYLKRFLKPLAESYNRSGVNGIMHIHLVGDGRCISEYTDFSKKIADENNIDLCLSFDDVNFSNMDKFDIERYCQCIRFIRMPELIMRYNSVILCIDIDTIILKDPFIENDRLSKMGDVGIAINEAERDIGRKMLAGCVWVKNTNKSIKYFNDASNIMKRHLFYAFYTEKLDQRALYMAYNNNTDTVFNLPRGYMSKNIKEKPYMYAMQGPLKNIINKSSE